MNKLLIVDGNSVAYRAYYGTAYMNKGLLTNSKGIPVNAVLTLNNILNRIITEHKPTHILVAFDAGKKTIRHKKLESYKQGRKPTPMTLINQLPIIKEMITKMGIVHYEVDQIEADDIVGTVTNIYKNKTQIMILSSDRDLFQLVQKNVSIIVPQNRTQKDKIINMDNFFTTYGYMPNQVVDIKGIVGDPSDNLVGIKGIGEKGALKLLDQYNNLENIYANIENFTPKIKEQLVESKEMAFLCKELAKLILDVKIPYSFNDLLFKNEIKSELINFFKEYELNSLIKKYENNIKKIENNSKNKVQTFEKIIF